MKCIICGKDAWVGSSTGTCSECLQVIIANSAPEDEEDDEPEGEPLPEPTEPEEGDWVTDDYIKFREFGIHRFFNVPPGERWQHTVSARMQKESFWPNVWFLSDHGNYELLSLESDE